MVTTRRSSSAAAAAANASAEHRALYKRTSISRTPDELKQRRVAIDESLRKKHREQLITAKRYRNLTRQEEIESAGEEDPSAVKTDDDDDEEVSPYYRLSPAQVEAIAKDLTSDNKETRIEAAQHIAKFVLEPAKALTKYITEGDCIKTLTQMISGSNLDEQIEAAQTISNIAAGPYNLWLKSVSTVPYLISLLDSDNMTLREIAAGALGNMAAEDSGDMDDEDEKVRAKIRDNGAIKPLVRMLDSTDNRLVQNACFALANLGRGQDGQLQEFFAANGLSEKLLKHLEDGDSEPEVCWVISFLTAGSEKFRNEFMEKGFGPPLVKVLAKLANQGPAVLPVLRSLGNLVGTEEFLKTLSEQDQFLPTVVSLTKSDQRAVKKEALWVLSNITSSQDPEIIKQIEELDVLKNLSELVGSGAFDIRKGAAFSILNIACHGPEHLDKLAHKQLLPAFLDLVKSQDKDMMKLGLGYIQLLLTQATKGKEVIDSVPECMEALAAVAPKPDPGLFALANKLVDQYFGESPDMKE